jgi:hypothetical protein
MIKKIVIYILLLNFLNTVFFYNNEPADYNIFNHEQSIQEEEINSLVEFVVEECMDIKDTTPEDEDDDWSDPFKVEKVDKCSNPTPVFEYDLSMAYIESLTYSPYYNSTFNKVFIEILSPPPRQA